MRPFSGKLAKSPLLFSPSARLICGLTIRFLRRPFRRSSNQIKIERFRIFVKTADKRDVHSAATERELHSFYRGIVNYQSVGKAAEFSDGFSGKSWKTHGVSKTAVANIVS